VPTLQNFSQKKIIEVVLRWHNFNSIFFTKTMSYWYDCIYIFFH